MQNIGHSKPQVSIIIPSYNKHTHLRGTVSAIQAQTLQDWEAIIVNDYPDKSKRREVEAIAEQDDRIKVIHNDTNQGIAESRNIGIRSALADIIGFNDHDDLAINIDKLALQYNYLQHYRDIVVLGSQYVMMDEDGNMDKEPVVLPDTDEKIRAVINIIMPCLQSSILVRKEVFNKIGLYKQSYAGADDYEFLLRAGKVGRLQNISDVSVAYRNDGVSANPVIRSRLMQLGLRAVLEHGRIYPKYSRAILIKIAMIAYARLRPYLPETITHALQVHKAGLAKHI